MSQPNNYSRFAAIAKSIQRAITADGGTWLHVSSCTLTIPARTYDRLCEEGPIRGDRGTRQMRLYGVLFQRGEEEAAIQSRAGDPLRSVP